jgi:glycosyltransferase involved in cell wall biosynthesis
MVLKTKLLVSVIFNFKNEEQNIPSLISRTKSVFKNERLENYGLELVFVNDRSTDNSIAEIHKNVLDTKATVINMSRNFGRWPCLVAGIKNSNGDLLIYMDCDLQDPPELILEMIGKYEEGYDIVHTRRVKRHGESKLKLFITNIAYRVIKILSNIKLENNVSDFKLMNRKAANNFLEFRDRDPYVRGISVWIGFKQTYIDYERTERNSGKTQFPIFGKGPALEFVRGITSFSTKILYILFIFGLVSIIGAFFLSTYFIYLKIVGDLAPGVATLSILILILFAIIIFFIGTISLYLARIIEETTNRPLYIIDEIIKINEN